MFSTHDLPFFGLALAGLLTAFLLLRTLVTAPPEGRRYELSLEELGGFSYWRLALISCLGLFLEMLMIRWISSEIRIFAYFKNFVLIACFLGFGLGCYFCRRRVNLLTAGLPLLLLAFVVKSPWEPLRELIVGLPQLLAITSDVQIWGTAAWVVAPGTALLGLALAAAVVVALFALLALTFVPVGQMVGWYLESAHTIAGYTVNIVFSLAGVGLYTVLCLLWSPPAIWFAVAGLGFVALFWRRPKVRWGALAVFATCVAAVLLPPPPGARVYWSPYQKLTLRPLSADQEIVAYQLNTNDSWYQWVINLSPDFARTHPIATRDVPLQWNAYNLPYRFQPTPASVLVLGAGMGNDVAAALRNGAGHVTAVEIDPLILHLGRQMHFEHPYKSPRVTAVVDDARSYVQNARQQFDLIVFSLLDSHTTSSSFSNIRIDNYVYTVEAFRAAQKLLKPNGIFIVKFQVNAPWIAGRLRNLLQQVFQQPPIRIQADSGYTTSGQFFIVGSPAQLSQALADPQLADYVSHHDLGAKRIEDAPVTTDDWPYFYQRRPGLPLSVLVISAIIALLCWLFLRSSGVTGKNLRWHFFFLGAGFMLLEAQIISKMALLFGTTWLVNSIVVAGLMLIIVAANYLIEALPRFPLSWAYAGIAVTLALAYFIPMQSLLFASIWTRGVLATLVLCLPVFFAGMVFIRSFAAAEFSAECLGSNLLGSLIGGMLESLSFWTGIRSLVVLAAVLYLASALALVVEARRPAREMAASASAGK